MEILRWVAFGFGIALVASTFMGVVRALLVPRGASRRISSVVGRVMRFAFHARAARHRPFAEQDRILAIQAPAFLLMMLFTWLTLFLAGYALILWPLTESGFWSAVRESGSAMFTLGFAPASEPGPVAVHFIAAFSGLLVMALQIAYLPVLYAAFNRRETLVSMLDTRAGTPAWGPELLARHALVNIVDNLPRFYADWETWTADVSESHTNYPVLLYFRSPQSNRNWVTGLLAVMDSAALYLAVAPSRAPSDARLCVRMGFTALRDIAGAARIVFDPDPMPNASIALTREEFDLGLARLREADFPIEVDAEEAWQHFRGWRVNYEAIAYALADRVDAVRAPWSGPRTIVAGDVVPPFRPADRRPDDPDAARAAARPSDPRR